MRLSRKRIWSGVKPNFSAISFHYSPPKQNTKIVNESTMFVSRRLLQEDCFWELKVSNPSPKCKIVGINGEFVLSIWKNSDWDFLNWKKAIFIALPLKETVILLICERGMSRIARVSGSNGPGKESTVSILPNRQRHHNWVTWKMPWKHFKVVLLRCTVSHCRLIFFKVDRRFL